MWQLLKRTWWVLLLAVGVQSASAFSMLGNKDDWQVHALSYDVGFYGFNEGPVFNGDVPVGGPMNLGEEFRWNIPIVNYAFDQNFLDYFGSNGVYAIEEAIAILNNVSNISSYSSALSEVPLEATRENFRASALGLMDLKSAALHYMVEKLGLADPVRHTWTLRQRVPVTPPGCPFFDYLVVKRNFDPVSWEPSSYVNGVLYTYRILEFCPADDSAEVFEHRVDPLSHFYTAVASPNLFFGFFYTGLTRDDVGGLRYLLRTNNVNKEDGPLNSTLISGGFTNSSARQLLTTSNLATLVFDSLTNGPAALQALYPGLCILSSTTTFTNVVTTNMFAYFTNFPYSPAGSPASLVLATNRSTNVEPRFHYTFCNVVTNKFYTNGFVTTRDITVSPDPYAPAGSGIMTTNVKNSTGIKRFVNGDYFLVPPGLCGYSIVSTQLITVITVTNTITTATNAQGVTNVNGQSFERDIITYFTNYIFVVDPIECGTNGPAFHQGIDKMTFVRKSFDSLLGQFFEPVTNRFQLTMVTNSTTIVQIFERVINQPDILFSADDVPDVFVGIGEFVSFASRAGINFNTNNVLNGLPGPGLIEPSQTLVFNKKGPSFLNQGPFFMDEPSNVPSFVWGSYDSSTNAPIIYPSGTSIAAYENQVLMQVTTTSLPGGTRNSPYNTQLQGSGGQTPYSWALVSGMGTLPPGLGLSAGGTISGTPTVAGTFKFTVRMTDSGARSVTRELSITISP